MLLDGPVGTALWLPLAGKATAALTHPAAVRAIHARSVKAGAEAILSATFAAPFLLANGSPDITTLLNAALDCAAPFSVPLWIAFGPPAGGDPRRIAQTVLTWAARTAREGRARGVWLETCRAEDGQWLNAACDICERLNVEYVVTFAAHAQAARELLQSRPGAHAVGLNCGLQLMDERDAEALASARLPAGQRRVFKPATQLGAARLSPARVKELALAARADWAGVCCGGDDAHLLALSSFKGTR